ncbi:hypothetical protein EJB05_29058 [Eragrostis curvula]|uniref:Disease resistance protein At4g27190-like leucine-rich repeats domain-containing protein n=1 Tax=Eragrostis curvula TaxID=38414 RepID=A0A5J9UT93_9POAL|nr:hypothetical protein EJB05_29058 [Eragrostis curvula]
MELTQVFKADTIDEAVEKILDELKEDAAGTARSSRCNVIYFDGWDGMGASAVLHAVGRRLTPAALQENEPATRAGQRAPAAATGLQFSHIFHIDCSKWESRRVMQRMIAEKLKLPDSVMEMFDTQDEEDDYQGVGKGSRCEIPRVAEVMNQHIQKLNRFLLIFYNGSCEEIDLSSLGFPLFDRYSRSKLLWSFQGRFRVYPRMKVERVLKNTMTMTDVVMLADSTAVGEDKLLDILRHEAEEVAHEMIHAGGIDWPAAAANCFLYMVKLCRMGSDLTTDYDLATHVCNYWICDGVIQLQQGNVDTEVGVDKLWLYSYALQREIRLDVNRYQNSYFPSPAERRMLKRMSYWTSPTYGFMLIPHLHGHIPKGMFQQFDKLCVLKLSACQFSFTSPPFLCCHNLRFLWLEHCQEGSSTAEVVEEDIHRFLQRLWVLDVRYSNKAFLSKEMMAFMIQLKELNVVGEEEWCDMDLVQSQLHNIRRLRVTECSVNASSFFSEMDKMELLCFSKNFYQWSSIHVGSCRCLETLIINGSTNLRYIYLMECAKLKNLFLSGSFDQLYTIDITGVAVETLDLSTVTAPKLCGLYLLGCEKLCAILWPPAAEDRSKRYLDELHIVTTQNECTTAAAGEHTAGRPPSEFNWHVSVRDARILGSLESVNDYFGPNHAYVDISSPSHHPCAEDAVTLKDTNMQQQTKLSKLINDAVIYTDVAVTLKGNKKEQKQADEDDSDAPVIMCLCPPPPSVLPEGCYIHIEDQTRTVLQTASTIPAFICNSAKILHVHDSLHITKILGDPLASTTWNRLEWCRVERCPKLGCVFSPQLGVGQEGSKNDMDDMFKKLRTIWASHLPKARYIWKWSGSSKPWLRGETFENLTFLHLDCCPRLLRIIHFPVVWKALDRLKILEVMWCCDLSVAFHFYDVLGLSTEDFDGWIFNKLKHIRMHELPKLQNICNVGLRISVPELETIKIRGCWSLRTLPIVKSNNVVECDCEKEWWDRLQWESPEHASQYKPIHPRYDRKTMLIKGSVLR